MTTFHPVVSQCMRFVKPAGTLALGIVVCATAVSSAAAGQPDVIYLDGTVRDFLKSHPDFNITSGTNHVANNVELASEQNHPAFTDAGFEVGVQWRNKFGDEIAPHLYYASTLALGSAPSYNPDNVTIDSWDSSKGTYDPGNAGPAPSMEYPAPMPEVSPPEDLDPHPNATGGNPFNYNLTYSSDEYALIDYSFQCRSLTTGQNVTIEIAPNTDVTIYTTREITLGQNSKFVVPETSTLRIYFNQGGMTVGQGGEINMTQPLNPARCVITNLGNSNIEFHQTGGVCAHIISPGGAVNFNQANDFFGTIVADGLHMDQGTALHWDGFAEVCNVQIEDVGGSASSASSGAITSSDTFDEWFITVPGTNMAYVHTIALTLNAAGVYEYHDEAFFPIDDMLFGNEGEAHNYNFTYMFKASFEHEQCADRFFEFAGADDAWVYINGELAMDLGGVMAGERQVIEIDRLGLEHGETYTLHFYYAQRNPYTSVFKVTTDLPLESNPPSGVSMQYD